MKKLLFILAITSLFACTQSTNNVQKISIQKVDFTVKAKIRLDYIGTDLMENYYQKQGLLPLTTPYFSRLVDDTATVITTSSLAITGANAIVDWVVVELRYDDVASKRVLQTRSGLLQADGNIVGLDGISPIKFHVTPGNYYVSVKHRNHLGIRTTNKYDTNLGLVEFDFTDNSVPLNGQFNVVPKDGYMHLISGDANGDGDITGTDYTLWEQENGLFDDYKLGTDYNGDGSVDALDTILSEGKNGMYEEVE